MHLPYCESSCGQRTYLEGLEGSGPDASWVSSLGQDTHALGPVFLINKSRGGTDSLW